MSKKTFTDLEMLDLSKNKYVKNVTSKGITYTNEFKLQFIAEYENGKTSRKIFEDAGFDVDVIGIKRIESASLRWRAAYKDKGVLGLEDTRTLNSGRTLNRDLTVEEILAKKDAEIAYLKAELELIKKLELQERQVISKKIPSSIIFNLIQNLIKNFNLKNMTRHLCKIANVSASGYYKFLSNFRARRIKEHKDLKSKEIILKAFNYRGYKKGSRSIKMVLENKFNIIMNRKKIQRIMRKYNIIFHGSIILFAAVSLIISFMTLSKINTISNKINENSTVYYGTTNTSKNLTTNVNSTAEKPIEIVVETNNDPVLITRAGKYHFVLKDRINDTYVIAKCIDISNSKENSLEKQKYSVIDYCTSQEEATVFSGNSEMIEYTIEGFNEGRYQLIGVDAR